jgi:hypothetical protein
MDSPVREMLISKQIESPAGAVYKFSPCLNMGDVFLEPEDVADARNEAIAARFFEIFDAEGPLVKKKPSAKPKMAVSKPKVSKPKVSKPKVSKPKVAEAAAEGVKDQRFKRVQCGMSRHQRYLYNRGEMATPKDDHLTAGIGQGMRCLARCKNSYCDVRGCVCGADAVWE